VELFVTDLDGTLLHSEYDVKKPTVELIKDMQKKGIKVATATGRILRGVRFLKEEIGLDLDYYVLGNGSVVTDSNFNIIYKRSIDYKIITALYNYLDKVPLKGFRNALSNEVVYCLSEKPETDKPYFLKADIEEIKNKEIVSFVANYQGRDIKDIEEIAADMKQRFTEVEVFQNQYFIDIAPKGVSKATGIKSITEKLGDVKKLYTIGDSYNDIPMLKMTENSFTFSTSPEVVKKSAGKVVDNFDDCITDYILTDKK
jgi:Cof subfamily protein (haloacid dehalogenase superfamily)